MKKTLMNRASQVMETPERIAWVFENILKDEELQSLWFENQKLLDADLEQHLTVLEREQYLIAKTIQDDILAMIGDMSREERKDDITSKNGIYSKLERYMKITAELVGKAMKRAALETNEEKGNPFSSLGNAVKVTAITDKGIKVDMEEVDK